MSNKITAHISWPSIAPLQSGVPRPLWSVMIPAYNCDTYLGKALRSVLEQDLGPENMQIEVVDDCSKNGNPEKIVRRLGHDRVEFFRQPKNIGPPANFNTCIKRARGRLIHILHGDDMINRGFYSHLGEAFGKEPSIGAVFCRSVFIDKNDRKFFLSHIEKKTPGIIPRWLEHISLMNWLQSSSIVVKRSVYEKIGGFCEELVHANDWDMWKRIALHYPVWHEPKPLAFYRYMHPSSHSYYLATSGANISDSRKAIRISRIYLPESIAEKLSKKAERYHAVYALKIACRQAMGGRINSAKAQIQEALSSINSLKTAIQLFFHFAWDTICSPWRTLYIKMLFFAENIKDEQGI